MNDFFEYLQSSALVQGVLTLLVTAAVVYLIAAGIEVPTILETLVTLSWGFFFGAKIQNIANKVGK